MHGGKREHAGRPKGSKSRLQVEASEIMAECDFDPIRQMIYVAKHPKASLELRGKMGAELAKYRHPQLRSHEHSGEGGGPIAQEIVVRRLDR